MNREVLWAPWRIKYVTAKKHKGCILCKDKDYIVFNTKYSFCILNIFPYNNGHVMVSPKRHVKELSLLEDTELLDLFKAVNTAKGLLDKALNPDGYNIGINLSRSAGAGITGHIHIHIVPRWHGDTNFMPVMHNTRVIAQSLEELYKLLKHYAKSNKD